jgi:alkanesulfonate monooxygenase SsuD/methylene tetrahydromethanopterin reductase-like flavin-dependent oxidoreductase (luciferase family)
MPIWLAVGGNPNSAMRAGTLGLPLALAIIGGTPDRFLPFAQLYREAGKAAGHAGAELKIGVHSHGFVAKDSQEAADVYYPSYAFAMTKIGRERGWQPMTRVQYEVMRRPKGALLVGSPQQVIEKILYEQELFKLDRFLMHFSVGTLPHDKLLRSIELFATDVAPAVRKATAAPRAAPAST